MKPWNFPERINQRRKSALERLLAKPHEYKRRKDDISALEAGISETAIGRQSKKRRVGARGGAK